MTAEKRSDQRLRYRWPVHFSQKVEDTPSRGRMVDVSSTGAAFLCSTPDDCPRLGKALICRFSVPRFGSDISFDAASFKRVARVCRIDKIGDLRRIAVQFITPLPLKPDAQPISKYDRTYKLITESRGLVAASSPQFNPTTSLHPS
jgi:hypothetical protein